MSPAKCQFKLCCHVFWNRCVWGWSVVTKL